MTELRAEILVPKPLTSRAEGRKFLEIFINHFPHQIPERVDEFEPPRMRFDPKSLDPALSVWGRHFIGQRGPSRSPSLDLSVSFPKSSPQPRHTGIGVLRFQTERPEDIPAMADFVLETSKTFGADYATAHILTRTELDEHLRRLDHTPGADPAYMRRRVEREGFGKVLWGMTVLQHQTVHLRKYLPELLWLTVFGPPYVEMFGRDRLLATPAFKVQPLSAETVAIQLTEDLPDTLAAWDAFGVVRESCKQHLGMDAFCNRSAPAGHVYRVPQFNFPAEMYKTPSIPRI